MSVSPLKPFDTLHSDILIIGAGVAGLSSALEFASRGARVTILERGHAGAESTWAGAGILSPLLPWDYSDDVNALSEYSRSLFPRWCEDLLARSGLDPEYRRSGMMVMPMFDEEAARAWCDGHGWHCEDRRSGDFLDADTCERGLWLRDVAQVRNPRLIKALRASLEGMGVSLHEGIQIADISYDSGRVNKVCTNRGDFSAHSYVVAAGAWTGELPGLEAFRARIFPVRGQMLLFKLPPEALTIIVYRDGHYLIPRADGHVLVGSTLEYVGFEKATTEHARKELLRFAVEMFPLLGQTELVYQWSGLRPGSPRNIPVIGSHQEFENLFINSGHFRYGVTMAPGSAKLLASQIFGESPAIPVAPYAASRVL